MRRPGINALGIIFGILSIIIVIVVAVALIGQQSFRSPFAFNMDFKMHNLEDMLKGNQVEEKGEERFTDTYDRISIDAISGSVEITGWDENYIKLDYTKFAPSQEYLDYLVVDINKQGNELSIEREFTGTGKPPRGDINFHLFIPKEMAEEIEAETTSGKIICRNISDKTDLDLQSTSGRIETDNARDFTGKSISGEIHFRAHGENIELRSTSGRINGEVKTQGNKGNIDIRSVSGSIRLLVPKQFEADIDLRSVSGSVDTDFPIDVISSKRNSIEGTIGNGGMSVKIKTTSGSIRIQEAAGNE